MADLVVIDVGGTSIKHGVMHEGHLTAEGSVPTPATLPEYYSALSAIVADAKKNWQPVGVGISSPGAVNKKAGVIEGASAVKYIHNFPIIPELAERFGLPVSIENDANCAALAELASGAAQGSQNMLFLVIGTGIGGSVIVNGEVIHGRHLFGGEFGYMMMNDTDILSRVGSPVHLGERYTDHKDDGQVYSGKDVLNLAEQGDSLAKAETEIFYKALATAIYNLSYAFDPDKVILGGGVSQADFLIPHVKEHIQKILDHVRIAPFMPDIALAHYRSQANLIGAATDFWTEHADLRDDHEIN